MKYFVDELKEQLELAGIKILPVYDNMTVHVAPIQCHCGSDVSALQFVEYLKTIIKNNQIQFMRLPLPTTTEVAQLHRKGNVLIRYIEYFVPGSDKKEARYDVLLRL